MAIQHQRLRTTGPARSKSSFPANIAHLFLFDGEQVAAYASQEESSALIGSAIQNLLGLDMVDQLERDLLVYERRKRSEKHDDSVHVEITELQDKLSRSRQRIDSLKQERAALRTHRIDRCERELLKAEEDYRKLGGTLYDKRELIEQKWTDARRRVREGQADLREFASGPAPLLLVRALLALTEARDQQEEECRRARYLSEALNHRDRATLKHLRSRSVDRFGNRCPQELSQVRPSSPPSSWSDYDRSRHAAGGSKRSACVTARRS